MLYFAYGSNMNVAQMKRRCPKAKPLGVAVLSDYRLIFRVHADIEKMDGKRVMGVVWNITGACEAALDRYEGFPWAYGKRRVTVRMQNGETVQAMTYVQNAKGYEPPSREYYQAIVDGFNAFNVPRGTLIKALSHSYAEGSKRMRTKERPEPAWTDQDFFPESAPVIPMAQPRNYAARRYEKWLAATREKDSKKCG